jgi:hypothetical protein
MSYDQWKTASPYDEEYFFCKVCWSESEEFCYFCHASLEEGEDWDAFIDAPMAMMAKIASGLGPNIIHQYKMDAQAEAESVCKLWVDIDALL